MQLALEQQRSEMPGSTYIGSFINKYTVDPLYLQVLHSQIHTSEYGKQYNVFNLMKFVDTED